MVASRILLVDDTPENIDVLRATLASVPDCQLSVATTGERALELVQRNTPDLILLDVMMPGLNGFETCKRLRALPEHEQTPVIFVTARSEDVAEGFAAGGDDYISKPINPDEVRVRVNNQLEKQALLRRLRELNASLDSKVKERTVELATSNRQLREEIKERRYMQDRLQYLATHDFVTHLYNRNALDDYVTETISLVQLAGINAVFLQIDLERFRLVNESCGCFAGDELLRQFADLVSGLVDSKDIFARLGGDKFAIVCRGKSKSEGLQLAASIQQQLASFDFLWESRHFNLAAIIALVNIDTEIISFDQLMLMADEVLYHLKKEKRHLLSHDELNTDAQNERGTINWALKLMDAFKHNHFRAHFQKIASLNDNRAQQKIELLVRLWDNQRQSLIYPDAFIPAAERFNLITEIDRWMIQNFSNFMAANKDACASLLSVSINLSAISIRDPNLANFIKAAIESSGLPATAFCFEITETEAIVNMEITKRFFNELHEFGCQFALDDFGSGFSSFNYLRELPFDLVKIDGVFVRDMDKNPAHYAMVKSIVEIAKQLDKTIIAEFVENAEVAEALKQLGVSWAQGYFYHRPEELSVSTLLPD